MILRYVQFWFFRKELGTSFTAHIVYDFSKKICGSYSINWFSFIVRLHLLLEILGNVCIMITSYLTYEVINFQIKLSFLIKPFIYMTKMSGQKSLWTKFHKQRDLFGVYKKLCSFSLAGDSVVRNYLRPESAPLSLKARKHLLPKVPSLCSSISKFDLYCSIRSRQLHVQS